MVEHEPFLVSLSAELKADLKHCKSLVILTFFHITPSEGVISTKQMVTKLRIFDDYFFIEFNSLIQLVQTQSPWVLNFNLG